MRIMLCNDGLCPITRKGGDRHPKHILSKQKIKSRYLLEGISVLVLIIGIYYGLVAFTIDGLNQIQFAFSCVNDAIYENASSDEYKKCTQEGIDVWFNAYYMHIVSTIFLAASAVIALLVKRNN